MRFLIAFAILFSLPLYAEDDDYGPPITLCLNKHAIPYINTTIPVENIVNGAYKACDGIVNQWNRERTALPKEMNIKQDKDLREMYIRMIEIRRKNKK
ncbi:hypothetical protein [Erwinia sp. JH02]|uniref:hypothetical protein n=1 Tax=Erwinia sp. JH02 TaxID=2733394 RepID=UPI0014881A2E|nr:hypothetical protein [Erwinia sp. JH02]NNS09417.1 hypothetical protein [Erwinia sp. JH02]